MRSVLSTASALAALFQYTAAQTFSDCDPTKKTGCPSKPGLNQGEWMTDFTKGAAAASGWTATSNAISYDAANGALFSIKNLGEGPTIQSDNYIFFGYVEVKMRAAPGAGVVSSVVLQSDNLDEIDWEWIGSDSARGQTNYFGKGNTTTYDRGEFHTVSTPQSEWHTYAVDWKPDQTKWIVDGNVVRTLNFADAVGGKNYPQTPTNIRMGNWVAGTPGNSEGTIQWAGGLADMAKGPFNMYVQYIKVINYNPAESYKYGDNSGTWQSIQKLGAPAEEVTPPIKSPNSGSTTGPSDNVPFQNSTAPGSVESGSGSSSSSGNGLGSGSGTNLGSGYGSGSGSGAGKDYTTKFVTATTTSCPEGEATRAAASAVISDSQPTGSRLATPVISDSQPTGSRLATPVFSLSSTGGSGGFATSAVPARSTVRPSATSAVPVQFTGAASKMKVFEEDRGVMALLLGALLWVVAA